MIPVLALDQGTTSTRALRLWPDGRAQMVGALRHAQHHPAPGLVEHDPLELLANLRALVAQAGPLAAIGLCHQGESCLAWDAQSGAPLSPVIVWQDSRTEAALAALRQAGHADWVQARSGLPLDPYFSASKLGWLMRLPAVQAAHAAGRLRLGTTDAFFLQHLTGACATDASTASRSGLLDLDRGVWDADLCALFGVPADCLPPIRPSMGDFGTCGGVPVLASLTDQQAALFGHGCHRPGQAKITFGTGAFALALTGDRRPDPPPGLLPTIAWDLGQGPIFALEGGVYDAGSAVDWAVRAGLATDMADFAAFDAPPAIARGLVFVPAFSGLAAPHWDREAAPLMIGLGPQTTRRDLCQALLEGIALLTADVADLMGRHAPLAAPLAVDGGLTRSPYFCRFLASVTGGPVAVPALDEVSALGTARLSAQALGWVLPDVALPPGRHDPLPGPVADWRAVFAQATDRARGWQGVRAASAAKGA